MPRIASFVAPVVAVLLSTLATACTIGWGMRAPGVNKYLVLQSSGVEYLDSSGRPTDFWSASSARSWSRYSEGGESNSALGLGMRGGLSQIEDASLKRTRPGMYVEALAYYRNCPAEDVCWGLDGGWLTQGSGFTQQVADAARPGSLRDQELNLGLSGWRLGGLFQQGFFDQLFWLEAGAGIDRLTVARDFGQVQDAVESKPTLGWHWSAGLGVGFEYLGLRVAYQRTMVAAEVAAQAFDLAAAAWVIELIL